MDYGEFFKITYFTGYTVDAASMHLRGLLHFVQHGTGSPIIMEGFGNWNISYNYDDHATILGRQYVSYGTYSMKGEIGVSKIPMEMLLEMINLKDPAIAGIAQKEIKTRLKNDYDY